MGKVINCLSDSELRFENCLSYVASNVLNCVINRKASRRIPGQFLQVHWATSQWLQQFPVRKFFFLIGHDSLLCAPSCNPDLWHPVVLPKLNKNYFFPINTTLFPNNHFSNFKSIYPLWYIDKKKYIYTEIKRPWGTVTLTT